ncbi:hypothetical protein SDC9_65168 [bioreactor metagenome]|uniref:Uncharacterized protein n=1 Tax=bioreactor metagenome TaxID=1076179 RepID=A0A644XWT9_9ZZZZ
MRIPTRDKRRAEARHGFRADDDVLADFVQGMSHMDSTVGVRRAIVKHKSRFIRVFFLSFYINIFFFPFLLPFQFTDRQVGFHRKSCFPQVQRIFHFHCRKLPFDYFFLQKKTSSPKGTKSSWYHPNLKRQRPEQAVMLPHSNR